MPMSCADFENELEHLLIETGLIMPGDVPDGQALEPAFRFVAKLIRGLAVQSCQLGDLVDQASGPGGIGQDEFGRPGGWREQALEALNNGPLSREVRERIRLAKAGRKRGTRAGTSPQRRRKPG